MAYKLAPCGGIKLDETNFTIDEDGVIKTIGGSSGATDYTGLSGKPQINGHELASGDNSLETLGIQAKGNYITQGSKIAATDITEDGTHKFVTDTEKSTWNGKANNTVASGSANGLMSSAHFTKLEGIATNANNYTLPAAKTSAIGGVKQATAIPEASGENVTKAEFKALLDALKAAGIMASA